MSEMGRCRDCRFWKGYPPDSWYQQNDAFAGKGQCAVVYAQDDLPADQQSATASALIATCGCCAVELVTRPDFGCVQFEAREPEPIVLCGTGGEDGICSLPAGHLGVHRDRSTGVSWL